MVQLALRLVGGIDVDCRLSIRDCGFDEGEGWGIAVIVEGHCTEKELISAYSLGRSHYRERGLQVQANALTR